jgi:acyl-CoA reductase-like NAD-dependent aldehyde dehydrogenase
MKPSRVVLSEMPASELIACIARAGEIFREGRLPCGMDGLEQDPRDYLDALSNTTGLPFSLCRSNMEKLYTACTSMDSIVRGLTRGLAPTLFDDGLVDLNGLEISFYPVADFLGVVLPSNSPGVNSLWLPALAMKTPVVLKPGREDPWTPYRLIQALIAAGVPREAFGFYPADHGGAEAMLIESPRALVFGGDQTVARYADKPHIQVHGAGRSKVLVDEDYTKSWEDHLDVLVDSVAGNSGRSCINASVILTSGEADAIAEGLARRLVEIEPLPMEDEHASLAGFANPSVAEGIDALIEERLAVEGARDVTAELRPGPRLRRLEGRSFLLPTVVRVESMAHPLANSEFLFPFVSVVEMPRELMLAAIGPTLVVTALTRDERWIGELLRCDSIDRLNVGPIATNWVQWDQPHEGNLFEYLYRRRAIQRDRT